MVKWKELNIVDQKLWSIQALTAANFDAVIVESYVIHNMQRGAYFTFKLQDNTEVEVIHLRDKGVERHFKIIFNVAVQE